MSNNKYSWEEGISSAKKYYIDYGNLLVPKNYCTENDFPLGKWISYQRKKYNKGTLDKNKIDSLEKIGMVWDVFESEWWKYYSYLKSYYETKGTIYPLEEIPMIDNYNLKNWISNQISNYNNPNPSDRRPLTKDKVIALQQLEIKWNYYDSVWDKYYKHAEEFYLKQKHLNIPVNYECNDGLKLGVWLLNQRNDYKLGRIKKERIEKLEKIAIIWDLYENNWNENYKLLKDIYEQKGSIYPISELPVIHNYNLSIWVRTQIYKNNKKKLSNEQITLLDQVGIVWNERSDSWDEMYEQAKKYYEVFCSNGLLIISGDEKYKQLKRWIRKQRSDYKNRNNNCFTEDRIKRLESIGMVWDEYDLSWEEGYKKASDYFEKYGSLDVTLNASGKELYSWIRLQRKKYKKGTITKKQEERLNSIGMIWDASNKSVRVSFPEKALYYYVSLCYEEVLTSEKTVLNGKELDIFIPKEKIAIEYDGIYYHQNRFNEDVEKCHLCKEKGISLIRIREKGLPLIDETLCTSITREGQDDDSLQMILLELFKILKVDVDVNVPRDHHEIADMVKNINSPFDIMYEEARKFYDINGHLNVPVNYKTSTGKNLNSWITTQRRAYYGKKNAGKLSNYNIQRLEKIGMIWDIDKTKWGNYYSLLSDYYKENGNLCVPRSYCVDEIRLGNYVHTLRCDYKKGKLEEQKIKELNKIGMIWEARKCQED